MSFLPPLPVALPLAMAGLLLSVGHFLPRRTPDVVALLTTVGCFWVCALMAARSEAAPLVYWFGNWAPLHGMELGIGFVVGPAGAGFAAFIALLFAATLVFAWGYFDEVHAHFHVLMLLFMGGMIGLCLTHDLFNMFVWFEVMSVAGFALTGYQLRKSALEGALNFTVTNTLGAYLILAGIGLIYARVGALDFSALQLGVARHPADVVVYAAFTLLSVGFLIKAAQVPFQFWLADAHAVAPSPVSVVFSGAMVAIGLFAVARLYWAVFAPSPEITHVVRTLFLGFGTASALIGALMAVSQRHLKRMLAFSTISHSGLMLIGLSILSQSGLTAMFIYGVGHGLVKAAMFMVAGILLAECGGIDEILLRGKGREVWPAGIAMALGGLLLAGLPVGLMGSGTKFLTAAAKASGEDFIAVVMVVSAACTGGAVLRASGRIFLGLGATPGVEADAPTEDETEKHDRPLWLMLAPVALLLVLAMAGHHAGGVYGWRAADEFMHPDDAAILAIAPPAPRAPASLIWPPDDVGAWISVALAIAIAGFSLARGQFPAVTIGRPVFIALRKLHSGLIGDYIAWVSVGLALFVLAFVV